MQDVIDAHVEREEEYSEMQKNKAECRREDRRKIMEFITNFVKAQVNPHKFAKFSLTISETLSPCEEYNTTLPFFSQNGSLMPLVSF